MNGSLKDMLNGLVADKKKLSAMVCLLAVALLMWGRLLLKNVPRTAVAEPAQSALANHGSTGTATTASAASLIARPGAKSYEVALVETVGRDLFRFDSSFYPAVEGPEEDPEPTKSTPQPTDDDKDAADRVQAVRRAATKDLQLQSTLLGTDVRAMINGELFKVGDKVRGFEIVSVKSRQVTVKKDGVEVVLEM